MGVTREKGAGLSGGPCRCGAHWESGGGQREKVRLQSQALFAKRVSWGLFLGFSSLRSDGTTGSAVSELVMQSFVCGALCPRTLGPYQGTAKKRVAKRGGGRDERDLSHL